MRLYWDTPDPYHYIRIQQGEDSAGRELDYDILIVGGEDHKTGQADRHRRAICRGSNNGPANAFP